MNWKQKTTKSKTANIKCDLLWERPLLAKLRFSVLSHSQTEMWLKKNLSFWWLTLLHQSPERKLAFLVDSKKNLLLTAASSVQEVNPTAGSWTLKLQHHVKQTEAEAELNLWITS